MFRNYALLTILTITFALGADAQRPGGPPAGGRPGPAGAPRPEGQAEGQAPRHPDWMKNLDADKNGSIDAAEFQAAIDATWTEFDRNADGTITPDETRPPRPEGGQHRPAGGMDEKTRRPEQAPPPPGENGKKILPPFFFRDRMKPGESLTRSQFEQLARSVFAEMDKNGDGVISRDESRPPIREGGPQRPDGPPEAQAPPPPPNARFIGAELRFGDKLTTDKPFSADTIIEDNRRLYDGTTVTKQIKGAVYRDSAGRVRREQPLDNVGGFNLVGDNSKPQMLVFINDIAAKSQYFLDLGSKVARKDRMRDDAGPRPEKPGPPDAKTESLGTKTIEGVAAEGTRITFEIPAGQLGNPKPIQVVDERWFSPELQVLVLSRHLDPLAGEHVFKLVNIKRSEPSADLFTVPAGFRVENQPSPRPE